VFHLAPGLRLAADNTEAGVFHRRRTGCRTGIGRPVGAPAYRLAASILADDPFGDIAAEVEEERLIVFSGPGEAPRLFEERCSAAELLDF
jgi:hypothetical protein